MAFSDSDSDSASDSGSSSGSTGSSSTTTTTSSASFSAPLNQTAAEKKQADSLTAQQQSACRCIGAMKSGVFQKAALLLGAFSALERQARFLNNLATDSPIPYGLLPATDQIGLQLYRMMNDLCPGIQLPLDKNGLPNIPGLRSLIESAYNTLASQAGSAFPMLNVLNSQLARNIGKGVGALALMAPLIDCACGGLDRASNAAGATKQSYQNLQAKTTQFQNSPNLIDTDLQQRAAALKSSQEQFQTLQSGLTSGITT